MEEGVGSWRRLHNEELLNLYASPNIRVIKSRMRWAGHVAHPREMRSAYSILVENPKGKRLLRRPTCRWEDNIRIDLRIIGWLDVD
jgi:hypothetical protein